MAMKIDLPHDSSGQVDQDKLAQTVAQKEPSAQAIDLTASNASDSDVPDAVRKAFQQGDQDTEQLYWRYWNPNYNFYGYGHYPYWGYNPYYPNYYPTWGYYWGGRAYPYSWGFHRFYNGYRYNYYYRY